MAQIPPITMKTKYIEQVSKYIEQVSKYIKQASKYIKQVLNIVGHNWLTFIDETNGYPGDDKG